MTNLIVSVKFSILVTNTTTLWPGHTVPVPCPEGMTGCAVYHCKTVYDTNSELRTIQTMVRRLEVTSIPELGLFKTNKNEWVSETHTPERREIAWKPSTPVVLERSSDWNDWIFSQDKGGGTVSNIAALVLGDFVTVTNVLSGRATNRFYPPKLSLPTSEIKSIRTNSGKLEIEMKE